MFDPARLVFIDETAVSTNMVRLRGRAPRGVRLIGHVPLGKWKTITFVAALRHDKMTAPMVVEGPMTGEMFLAYIEQCLVPTLKRSDIVVMGAMSRSGLKRMLIGNTAERLLDRLPCDLLIVKPAEFANRIPRGCRGPRVLAVQPLC